MMIPHQNIFCNTPWYELQIYWDGSYGMCCQEIKKIYPDSDAEKYNVRNMSIQQWMDSDVMRQARLNMFGNVENSECVRCYRQEEHSGTSRRHKANQKSVIFTRSNFRESFEQSPHFEKFTESFDNAGQSTSMPVDIHIDLGNYCNLACKMCKPKSSSKIAAQYVKWGNKLARTMIGTDWTKDPDVWNKVVDEIASIKNLRNVHFMGGETLITQKFEEFLDFMIEKQRFDLNFSFVTNGTIFNETLMQKLSLFNRVGIEVSIETLTEHNAYQRQGTDTDVVLANIERYRTFCNGRNITLTVRPALSLLTIGSYWTLLEYCLQNQLLVKCLLVVDPEFLHAKCLPKHAKDLYKNNYIDLIERHNLQDLDTTHDYNESNPVEYKRIIKHEIEQALSLLETPDPLDHTRLIEQLVRHCKKWDQIYGYDASRLYPELTEWLERYGYKDL